MIVGTGTYTFEVAPPWQLPIEGPNREVVGVGVNSKDEVHILTRSPHPVLVFTRAGKFLRQWGDGIFGSPHGIHVAADDCVYIADNRDHTVRKFSPTGELLFTFSTPGQPSETGYHSYDYRTIQRGGPPFSSPTNVAIGPDLKIFVSDGYGNSRVHRFSETGELEFSWGEPGSGPGEFHIPHSVFVDGHGTVYVADRENDRIQLFSTDGEYLSSWDDVRRPDDIFVTADDRVFVAEQGHRSGLVPGMPEPTSSSSVSRITVRDRAGKVQSKWGADESGDDDPCAPGNFFAAHGIWVDREGIVYVGEVIYSGNGREGEGGGAGWVPQTCHALQIFKPQ